MDAEIGAMDDDLDELEQAQRDFFLQKEDGHQHEEGGVGRFTLDMENASPAVSAVKGVVERDPAARPWAAQKQAGKSVWARRREEGKGRHVRDDGEDGGENENDARIGAMSMQEIQHEQEELLSKLDPAVVSKLLSRASRGISARQEHPLVKPMSAPQEGVHFPVPQDPDLDAPDFFSQLHDKYFPSLPSEPQKLSWMQPATDLENQSYDPRGADFALSSLRFDFSGVLLPPQTAHDIPVSAGLHHHADAPSAAGYSIPELTLLAHSTVPSQRSLAVRTLGRVGYKVRQRVYGDILTDDLLALITNEGVEELVLGLTHDHHLSVRNHAIEAAWLMHQSKTCR